MKLVIALGTRPEIIKLQPVIEEAEKRGIEYQLLHTGQHYDWNMSLSFFREFNLRKPNVFLGVRSGTQGIQLSRIIARTEKVLKSTRPDYVIVEGDTNSAVGVAIAASKFGLKVAHVEAGCRSFDRNMQEEMNRVLIADLAKVNLAPTSNCVNNLLREGVEKRNIAMVGHPLVEILNRFEKKSGITKFKTLPDLKKKQYALLTLHRNENVENKERLKRTLQQLRKLTSKKMVVFPIHPHTRKSVRTFGLQKELEGIKVIDPTNYVETLGLIRGASFVLTDSGGVQQEAALLGTPCVTIRTTTEWVETIERGVNFLAQTPEEIMPAVEFIERNSQAIRDKAKSAKGIFGRPGASRKILDELEGWEDDQK